MKKTITLLLALSAALLLSSCTGGNGSTTTTSPTKTDAPTSTTAPAATEPGSEQTLEDALYFELTESGDGYIITGIDADYDPSGQIALPSEHKGLPVVEIGDEAFRGYRNGGSIAIPEGVTRIGNEAFMNCVTLFFLYLPDSLTEIGDRAFFGAGLLEIEIPVGVTKIGENAFYNCDSIDVFAIPAGVIEIGDNCFNDCGDLESITVAEGNPRYHSAGNCLIETESKTLLTGCKNSEIPADGSVTKIGGYAFSDANLEEITIPDSVTEIGDWAFSCCSKLESVKLPAGLTRIGEYAFDKYCKKFTDVYFAGTEEQWAAITVGGDNDALASAIIHYNTAG